MSTVLLVGAIALAVNVGAIAVYVLLARDGRRHPRPPIPVADLEAEHRDLLRCH